MLKRVEVTWVDSTMLRFGWQDPSEYQDEFSRAFTITTVGYIVHRTKRELVLVMNRSTNGQVGDGMAIPMGCILKIRRI